MAAHPAARASTEAAVQPWRTPGSAITTIPRTPAHLFPRVASSSYEASGTKVVNPGADLSSAPVHYGEPATVTTKRGVMRDLPHQTLPTALGGRIEAADVLTHNEGNA